jgi:hypothetical protein
LHRQALPASSRVEELRKVDMPAVIAGGRWGLKPFEKNSPQSATMNLGGFSPQGFSCLLFNEISLKGKDYLLYL